MAEFSNPQVVLDVTRNIQHQNAGALAAFPRALQISVSDAQQVFPNPGPTVKTVVIFAGTARFGQDIGEGEGPPEDLENVNDERLEVDEGNPLTLCLELRVPPQQPGSNSSAGAASFSALGSVGLDTTDVFGAVTSDALTALTANQPNGNGLPQEDLWLFSDVFAEKNCNLNRLGYQATVLLQNQSLGTSSFTEIMIPHQGNVFDLDVSVPAQVVSPGALDVGVADGLQLFPFAGGGNDANRLLIFTGTALCNFVPAGENILTAAVFRVRLRFPMPSTLLLKGSATAAGLASIHSNEHQPALFGVNAARIVTDPTDGGTLVQSLPPLPSGELYLLAELRAAGAEDDAGNLAGVSRFTYQANVLVQDTTPDLDSILVRPAGVGSFAHDAIITLSGGADAQYDIQLNLTGPPPPNFTISLESSDPQHVFAGPLVVVTSQQSEILNNLVLSSTPTESVTVTATGKRRIRTATLQIQHVG